MRLSKAHSLYKLRKLVMAFTSKSVKESTRSLLDLLASPFFSD